MRKKKKEKGFIYLLHFSKPFKHARHYTGWAKDVERRTAEHIEGGCKCNPLVKAASAAGIRIEVARIYPGKTRDQERAMKNQGGASRRCPLCAMERKSKKPSTSIAAELAAQVAG